MASKSTTPKWEAPKFSINVPNQAKEWKIFYTRAIDFLEIFYIDPDSEGETKYGWQQIKMIFYGEDRQALQTLIDNNTITHEDQQTSPMPSMPYSQAKEEELFWHFRERL